MIKVSKFYDKKPVLKDISLSYFYGAKIGVLGLNGAGKSSLLRILAGEDRDFNGETILSEGHTVGYLEQEPLVDVDLTVRQVVEQGVQEAVDLLQAFEEINLKFAEPMSDDEMDKLIQDQAKVQEKLDMPWTPGTSTHAWKWPWMPCAARREIPRSKFFPAARNAGWPFAACCFKSRTFCCWTSRPTTLMPRASPGPSSTCKSIVDRHSGYPRSLFLDSVAGGDRTRPW